MSELRATLKGLRNEAHSAGTSLVKRSLLGAMLTVAISADERGGATLAIRSEPSDLDAFGDLRDSEGISSRLARAVSGFQSRWVSGANSWSFVRLLSTLAGIAQLSAGSVLVAQVRISGLMRC